MNYIKKLELENRKQDAEIVGLRAMVSDITAYLTSPKFHHEQWVNTHDVLNRFESGELVTQNLIDTTPTK